MKPRGSKPKTFRDVLALWPNRAVFARAIGVEYVNAQMMDRRDSIAAKYFPAVVRAAKKIDHPEITHELLAHLAERKRDAA